MDLLILTDLFFCISLVIVTWAICFLCGAVLFSNRKSINHFYLKDVLYYSLIGLTIILTVYALLITRGKTIFLGVFIIPIHYLLSPKRPAINETVVGLSLSKYWVFLIVASLSCGYNYFTYYYDLSATINKVPNTDFYFYAQVASLLKTTGIESAFNKCYMFDESYNEVTPYHFFDLYPTALLSQFTGWPTLKVYLCVVKPFFILLSFAGFASLFEKYVTSRSTAMVVGFLSLFFSGFFINHQYIVSIWGNIGLFIQSAITYKIEFYLPILILLIIWIIEGDYQKAIYATILLMLSNFSVLPSVFIGATGTIVIVMGVNKIWSREMIINLLAFVIFAIFFFFFYSIFGLKLLSQTVSINQMVENWSWTKFKGTIVDGLIKLFLLYGPFIILLVFWIRNSISNEKKVLLLFSGLTILSGLILWASNSYFYDAFQFSTIITPMVLNSLCILFVAELLGSAKRYHMIFSLGSFMVCIMLALFNIKEISFFISKKKNESPEFLEQVTRTVPKLKSKRGIYVAEFKEGGAKTILMDFTMSGTYLSLIDDQLTYLPYYNNLDWEQIALDKDWNYKLSPVYSFMGQSSLKKEDAIRRYIKEKDISFLVTKSTVAIPDEIKDLVEMRIESHKTGEVFIILIPN